MSTVLIYPFNIHALRITGFTEDVNCVLRFFWYSSQRILSTVARAEAILFLMLATRCRQWFNSYPNRNGEKLVGSFPFEAAEHLGNNPVIEREVMRCFPIVGEIQGRNGPSPNMGS